MGERANQAKDNKKREVTVKLPCNLAKQRQKQIYTDKNSRQQGFRSIHSQAEHQAHPAALHALGALHCGQPDGGPFIPLEATKFNFFAKDLQNQRR